MKKVALSCALLMSVCAAQAQQSYEPKEVPGLENLPAQNAATVEKEVPAPAPTAAPAGKARKAEIDEFCLFKDSPPADIKFRTLGEVKHAKGTYGPAKDIVPVVVSKATAMGANAIANYSGAQHFGFFPWRLARPIVHGTAITLLSDTPLKCSELGGTTVSKVMETGVGPEH